MTFDQAAARALIGSYHPNFVLPYEIRELKAALDEIERLQKVISEPVESFGTPELIAWANGLQKILANFPEEERGQIPFIMMMGCHLEKFAKSWNSSAMAAQAKRIAEYDAHERQTHEILGAILGEDTSLEAGARRAIARIAELEGAAKADESRLIAAAQKAGIRYFGCDTPDHLADRVVELQEALVEERARHMPFFCECKEGPSCKKTWHDCKFDICPRKKELLDRAQEQLRQEGLL